MTLDTEYLESLMTYGCIATNIYDSKWKVYKSKDAGLYMVYNSGIPQDFDPDAFKGVKWDMYKVREKDLININVDGKTYYKSKPTKADNENDF